GTHGFIYNPNGGAYTTIDDPSAIGGGFIHGTIAYGINDAGQIVGIYDTGADFHIRGFLYSGGFFTTIEDPAASHTVAGHTFAYGINNKGLIVGSLMDATGYHGLLISAVSNPPPPAGTTADMILRASRAV